MKKRLLLLALTVVWCAESTRGKRRRLDPASALFKSLVLTCGIPLSDGSKQEGDLRKNLDQVPGARKDITSAIASQLKQEEKDQRRTRLALQKAAQQRQKVSDTSGNRPKDPRNGARNQIGRKIGQNGTISRQANRSNK